MSLSNVAAIVLAAGKGTRMRSDLPKVLHPIGGRAMIGHLLDTVGSLGAARRIVVLSPDMDRSAPVLQGAEIAIQQAPRGTGDATRCAASLLNGFAGTALVLFGADPLISRETLSRMIGAREAAPRPAIVVLGFRPKNPGQYGRLVSDETGALDAIVEYWDADAATRAIPLCNSGAMAVDSALLFDLLSELRSENAKGEYYLTDIVAAARRRGLHCSVVEGSEDELIGIDDRSDLAAAEAIFQRRMRDAAMAAGATLIDPASTFFSFDTVLGSDVTVEPNVFFGPGVRVEAGAKIRAFSHLEGCTVERGAVVGPFARLRPGADVGAGAKVGNFVEIKNATLEPGAKVNHLTYIGDARVGQGANVGAGTITANYDGFEKFRTDIGAGASIGSNAVLVAPVRVGDGATVGAGTVVRADVPADALRVADTRSIEVTREGWSRCKRDRAAKAKSDR